MDPITSEYVLMGITKVKPVVTTVSAVTSKSKVPASNGFAPEPQSSIIFHLDTKTKHLFNKVRV